MLNTKKVLLILAAVVINTLTNEDKNIVDRSKDTKSSFEESQEIEILQKILIDMQSLKFSNENSAIDYISDSLNNEGITDYEVFKDYTIIKDREYQYSELIPDFSGLTR